MPDQVSIELMWILVGLAYACGFFSGRVLGRIEERRTISREEVDRELRREDKLF